MAADRADAMQGPGGGQLAARFCSSEGRRRVGRTFPQASIARELRIRSYDRAMRPLESRVDAP